MAYRIELNVNIAEQLQHVIVNQAVDHMSINHHEEVEMTEYGIALEMDWDTILDLERQGVCSAIAVFDDDRPVGYALYQIQPMLFYRGLTMGVCHALYVDPEHRKGSIGLRLIEALEQKLRDMGVAMVFHHTRPAAPQLDRLLERKNYRATSQSYVKLLGRRT